MNNHEAALEVLLILRGRLLDRLATTVCDQRASLLNGSSHTHDPLLYAPDVAQMLRRLSELDAAIGGLTDRNGSARPAGANGAARTAVKPDAENTVFSPFIELVTAGRLEEASQELARVLQLPLDRVITATRFFARMLKTNPGAAEALHPLARDVATRAENESVRMLIQTFGFQSIESRLALRALQTRESAGSPPTRR